MANPTNNDIMNTLQGVRRDQRDMRKMVQDHEGRLRPLENWKIAYEAAIKALEGAPSNKNITTLNKDFINIILKLLTLMTAVVGLTYLIVDKLVH